MNGAGRTALITGASSGIGEAFADVFASMGFDIVITARREEQLRAVAERLTRVYGTQVHVVPCDLAIATAPAALCAEIERRGVAVDVLVNNAGFGVPGSYMAANWAVHEAMLQVMVVAVAELTYRLLPGMIERGYGRIINVASLAGVVRAPAGTLYGAAKTFVVRFSESLSREVASHNIHVTAICPGLTRTGFHHAPGARETVSGMPGWMWMDAQTVARQGVAAVMAGKPIYVNGGLNRVMAGLFRYVPLPAMRALGRRVVRVYRRSRTAA
jgi:short-subunit dehydrogenase